MQENKNLGITSPDIKGEWAAFLNTVLEPYKLFPLIAALGSLIASVLSTNQLASIVLAFLATTFASVFGAQVQRHVIHSKEEPLAVARGRVSVRSLQLLLRHVELLDGRINAFLRTANDKEIVGLVERNYQEIRTGCRLMSEEVVSAIENWRDLVPEADVTTQIGIISDLKGELQCREDELRSLQTELVSQKGKSTDELARVGRDIARKEEQIRQLQSELRQKGLGLSLMDSRVVRLASVVDGWSPEMLGLPNPPQIHFDAADSVVAITPKNPV